MPNGECQERHRQQEFIRFLHRLDTEFQGDVPLHLITDNYGTHKHAKVKAWLKGHARFVSLRPHEFQLDESRRSDGSVSWTTRPFAAASFSA